MFYLLEVQNQLSDSNFNIQYITQNFYDIYINTIEINEIDKYDIINKKQERKMCSDYIKTLRIKTPSMEQITRNLSGGNQQKVIVANGLPEIPKC